ncbi:MAG: pyruvate formate-lyase-activating protein [Candidatus Gracilibacteria bacterium]|nr:pyruvate formate-lyase-activating protein [Candidatus Gracilibacteria bacterium]
MLKIHSIETFGAHEGPGIRTVFFLQGCGFKCLYCHNPDTISMKGGTEMSDEQLLKIVENNKIYFGKKGGVTASGGEPTLQAKGLITLFKELQNRGINTTLDTNGFVLNDDVAELLKYTDLVLLDIKHIDDKKHKLLTGQSNKNTLDFLDYIEQNNIKFWIRHVLVPDYTDNEEDIEKLGKYLQKYKSLERLEILPYHTMGVFKWKELKMKYGLEGIEQPTRESIEKCVGILKKYLGNVYVRG